MSTSEVVKHAHFNRDRVSISFTRKYNVAKFESIDLHVGLSSDKNSNEELTECFTRVTELVQSEFDALCTQLEKKNRM